MEKNQVDFCIYLKYEFNYPDNFYLTLATVYSVAALVTTVLNSLILISIWKTPSLYNPSYILIGSLALSDLLVGAFGDPLMVIYYVAATRGWSLKNFCLVFKSTKGVFYALGSISLLILMLISLDRLLAVKLRNRYQSVVTQKRVLYVLMACWLSAIVVLGALFGLLNIKSSNIKSLLFCAGILAFILVVIITVSYSMAFYSLRKITSSSVSPSDQNAEAVARPRSNIDVAKYRKSLITMFVVFICTIVFYFPFICTYIAFSIKFYHSKVSKKSLDMMHLSVGVAELIIPLNSAVNPLLYLWRIQDIREAVKTTVKTALKIF